MNFRKKLTILLSGAFISQIIPILISPILTRLYSPKDFGDFAYIIGIISILSIISSCKLETALPRIKSERRKNALVKIIFFIVLVAVFASSIILTLFIFNIKYYESSEDLSVYIFIPIGVFFTCLYQILISYFNAQSDYKTLAKSGVLLSVIVNGLKLIFGYLNQPLGLLLSTIISKIVVLLYYGKNNCINILKSKFSKKYYYLVLKDNIDFVKYNMPSSLFNNASIHVPIILMTTVYGAKYAGIYAFTLRFLQLPVSFLGTSIGQIYYKTICSTENSNEVKDLTLKLIKNQIILALPCLIILVFYGVDLFRFLFGEKWTDAGRVAISLAPWLMVVFISSPLTNLLILKKKQKSLMIYNIILFVTRCNVILACWYLDSSYLFMIVLLGFVGFLVWSIFIGHILFILKIKFRYLIFLLIIPFLLIFYMQMEILNYV